MSSESIGTASVLAQPAPFTPQKAPASYTMRPAEGKRLQTPLALYVQAAQPASQA